MKPFISSFRLFAAAEAIRASYWFLPTVMVVLAMLLASLTQWLDGRVDPDWMRGFSWLVSNEAAGARAVLSTIASSMITVAGVTFSMTIVSVSFASAQFGPRLVSNFMRDRGNQITLGTFIATFVFCLMVLRGVRDGIGANNEIAEFIPHISILVAVFFALASIGVLIYFIHHVPETINVGNIVARLGRDLKHGIDERFPDKAESGEDGTMERERARFSPADVENSLSAHATLSGYVQSIDEEKLLALAQAHDLKIRVEFLPGDFALRGEALAHALPKSRADQLDCNDFVNAFNLNPRPRSVQSPRLLVDQLTEIVGRALSPGVNDPYTAINCMNLLMDALTTTMRAVPPHTELSDSDGTVRLITNPYDFDRLAKSIFDQSLQYICADRNVTLHVLHMIATVGSQSEESEHRQVLRYHAHRLASAACDMIGTEVQTQEIEEAAETVMAVLNERADIHHLRESRAWLGGSA